MHVSLVRAAATADVASTVKVKKVGWRFKRLPRFGYAPNNLVQIDNGTFYNEHPSSSSTSAARSNPPLFPNLKFVLRATARDEVGQPTKTKPHWAVIGTNPTPFLKVLQGDYIAVPPTSRTYPYLSSDEIAEQDPRLRIPSQAIQYVGFNNTSNSGLSSSGGVRGAYLSARYESRREETDWSLLQYLTGDTELNPSKELSHKITDEVLFSKVVQDLRLSKLLDMPVSNLSNGQTRRSRIAKALLSKPEYLLLDEPFMGLDPPTLVSLSPILKNLAFCSSPSLVLGLRPQDPIPSWITHLVVLGDDNTVILALPVDLALYAMYNWVKAERQPNKNIAAVDVAMAQALKAAHGSPPFEYAHILTADGIHKQTAVQAAWRMMQELRGEDGLIKSDSPVSRGPQRLSPRLRADMTSTQWIQITSRLTPKALSLLRLNRESPRSGQKIILHKDTKEPTKDDSSSAKPSATQEPLIELESIVVRYGDKVVLGHLPPQPGYNEQGLNLTVSRGTRLLLLGPNGSGKTTLLSLLTSDHPQSYSLPIKFFGRTRLPAPGKPGLSLWEIQSRIGHSAPEVHAFFPKGLTVRRVLESAWSETYSSKPVLNEQRNALVDHFLTVWKPELCQTPHSQVNGDSSLDWASDKISHPAFGRLPFGTQRLLLLLRAIIKQPDIIILDEGFSGFSATVRDKALAYLEKGDYSLKPRIKPEDVKFPGLTDQQALVVVSHVREEVPSCINGYVRLPSEEEATEMQKPVQIGSSDGGEITSEKGWNRVWGL